MEINDSTALEDLLADLPEGDDSADDDGIAKPAPVTPPRRDLSAAMRRIPVTLTLEVGSARISLQDLMAIATHSVIELDTLAGEALTLKVNGTPIGRAEVVVSGENYGLKVIDLDGLDLQSFTS